MQYPLTFEQYQEGLREGRFLGLKCQKCNTHIFPSQGTCTSCGSESLEKTELKGSGTVRSFTVIRVAPEGLKPPYIVALVELEEGPWVPGNLLGIKPDEADMGLVGREVKLGSQVYEGLPEAEEDMHVLTFNLV